MRAKTMVLCAMAMTAIGLAGCSQTSQAPVLGSGAAAGEKPQTGGAPGATPGAGRPTPGTELASGGSELTRDVRGSLPVSGGDGPSLFGTGSAAPTSTGVQDQAGARERALDPNASDPRDRPSTVPGQPRFKVVGGGFRLGPNNEMIPLDDQVKFNPNSLTQAERAEIFNRKLSGWYQFDYYGAWADPARTVEEVRYQLAAGSATDVDAFIRSHLDMYCRIHRVPAEERARYEGR